MDMVFNATFNNTGSSVISWWPVLLVAKIMKMKLCFKQELTEENLI